MATNFPGSQDSFTNPSSGSSLSSPSHSQQHSDVNDAVEAIEGALLDGAPLHIDDANERVGIGTTSPDADLEIAATNAELKITSAEGDPATNHTGRISFENTNTSDTYDAAAIEIHGTTDASRNGHITFLTNPDGVASPTGIVERMRIDSSGRVGIGTSSPASTLHVNGEVQITGNNTNLKGSGNYPNALNFYHPTTGFWHQTGPRLLEGNRISWYWNNGSTYTEAMSMYPSGHMVKPLQPAFFAYLSGSNPTYGAGWTHLIHNATLFNVGGGYSTSTKRFTAPVAGRYLFIMTFSFYNYTRDTRLIVHMDKNGAGYSRIMDWSPNSATTTDETQTASVIMDLAVGNYVYPSINSADSSWSMSAGSLYNSFQGYFLG